MRFKKIGVFDSGYGGLTVLREIIEILPNYDYIYFGDSARAPYGSRSRDDVFQFTKEAVDFLFSKNCEIVILACNTTSAEALRKIQQEYLTEKHQEKKVLGVIIPAVEYLFENSLPKKIGVIGTEGTVKSGTYVREINKIDPSVLVFQNACPMLVPLIESGEISGDEVRHYLKKYLDPLIEKGMDSLILGCTHYALLEPEIKKILPGNVMVINQSQAVASKLADYLRRHQEIENVLSQKEKVQYYTTGNIVPFKNFGSKIIGSELAVHKARII